MSHVEKFAKRISERLDGDQISVDMPTRIVHRIAHGPESLLHKDLSDFTPSIVVKPRCREDVIEVVMLANNLNIPIVAQGGRTGTFGAEGIQDCVVLDFALMNKVLEFDEGAYRITAEAGIRIKDFNSFLQNHGYMSLEYPTMSWTSTLGARAAVSGYNKFAHAWGGSAENIKALEVVLADGRVLRLGRGSRVPVKNVTGFDLMSMFLGSKGVLGVITAVTEQFIDSPTSQIYKVWAFNTLDDALRAYMELLSSRYKGVVWKAKAYHKMRIGKMMEVMEGKTWPDDVEMVVDYYLVGEPSIIGAMQSIATRIMKENNGFWRKDIPDTSEIALNFHEAVGKYVGMGSLFSTRLIDGGMGFRLVPLDPWVPHNRLISSYKAILEHLERIEDGNSYPKLKDKLFVFDPGTANPGEIGYCKLFIALSANWKMWDEETRDEFRRWFRDYAEIVWAHGAALTGTHGFIPMNMQLELGQKEIGIQEYGLFRDLKTALDPKGIMNPKVRM